MCNIWTFPFDVIFHKFESCIDRYEVLYQQPSKINLYLLKKSNEPVDKLTYDRHISQPRPLIALLLDYILTVGLLMPYLGCL